MEKTKALEVLEASCVVVNGVKSLSLEKLQENGLLPVPKNDEKYLNECSAELTKPLNSLDYPLVYTATCKKSGSFEKTITSCVISTADFENSIVGQNHAIINVINKHTINEQPIGNYHKASALLGNGQEFVADVIIADKSLTLPVEKTATVAEITLQASFRLPGHGFVFTDSKKALDFYAEHKAYYTPPAQQQFLEQVKALAKMRGQLDSYINSRLQHELLKLDGNYQH